MKMKSDPLKVAFVGWGAINSRVADLLKQHSANVQFVGVAISNASKRYCGIPIGARQIDKPGDLADLAPDLVLEAASKAAVEEWMRQVWRRAQGVRNKRDVHFGSRESGAK